MSYVAHLSKDKRLAKVIAGQDVFSLKRRSNIFLSLCSSIMSQQLSTKVAEVIYKRFLALFGNDEPSPADVVNIPAETLRSIGLSNAKVSYVKNVAEFALNRGMDNELLDTKSNEEVIEYLTEIKGVGRWTVEMLLMFSLGREDVFAADDLGIQNAMIGIYGLSREDKKKFRDDLLRISKRWTPYRTYACLHLWQWKDAVPLPK